MDKGILNIKIFFGIELILRYHTIFEKLLQKGIVHTINVSLDKELLFRLRGQFQNINEFYEQYYVIMRWIFKHPNIHVVDDQSFPLIYYRALINKYGEGMSYYLNENLVDQAVGSTLQLPTKYITISTKVWSHDITVKYDQIKDQIIGALNTYNGKIVILGERHIAACDEYSKVLTKSMYSDLVRGLKDYEDRTYNDSSGNNEINKLKESFYILNKSSLNVFVTDSGVRIINLFLNRSLVGLTNCLEMSVDDIINFDASKMCFTSEPNQFIAKLQEFIQRLNQ